MRLFLDGDGAGDSEKKKVTYFPFYSREILSVLPIANCCQLEDECVYRKH